MGLPLTCPNSAYATNMRDFRVSPRGILCFCLFVALFGAAMMLDQATGRLNLLWSVFVWAGLFVGSVILSSRLWAVRHDPEATRRIQARGAYGLLPAKLRDWLFS